MIENIPHTKATEYRENLRMDAEAWRQDFLREHSREDDAELAALRAESKLAAAAHPGGTDAKMLDGLIAHLVTETAYLDNARLRSEHGLAVNPDDWLLVGRVRDNAGQPVDGFVHLIDKSAGVSQGLHSEPREETTVKGGTSRGKTPPMRFSPAAYYETPLENGEFFIRVPYDINKPFPASSKFNLEVIDISRRHLFTDPEDIVAQMGEACYFDITLPVKT